MCIVFFTSSRRYSLVLASNRDEFLARPTTRASWHCWTPSLDSHTTSPTTRNRVLSGLDLAAGGTWLGLAFAPAASRVGNAGGERVLRIATLTNFTETILPVSPPRPSRGNLVKDFLDFKNGESLEEYLTGLEPVKDRYAGFNLLTIELRLPSSPASSTDREPLVVGYCSNRETDTKKARVLPSFAAGSPVKGLSNATLEAEPGEEVWPKVKSGCEAVQSAIRDVESDGKGEEDLTSMLWDVLSTPSLSKIGHRSHLRNTVLVRPLSISPGSPLPEIPPPLPPPSLSPDPADLSESVVQGKKEGEEGTRWYGTRTQTIILIERETGRVVVKEREGYRLHDGKPAWVGATEAEHVFDFEV
ncbi:hypothetical protein JCM3766R1_004480 [Sporobolomyces carnicolor]